MKKSWVMHKLPATRENLENEEKQQERLKDTIKVNINLQSDYLAAWYVIL